MASSESLNAHWAHVYSYRNEMGGTYTEGHVATSIRLAKQHRGRWQNIPSEQPASMQVHVQNFATDEEHFGYFDRNGNGHYYVQAPGTVVKDGQEQDVTVIHNFDSDVFRQGNAVIGGMALELALRAADEL